MNVFIADAGAFGTAFAVILARAGHKVTLLVQPFDAMHRALYLNLKLGADWAKGANYIYLPNVVLPPMEFSDNFEAVIISDFIFLAVPSKHLWASFAPIADRLKTNPRAILVLLTKGFDSHSRIPWGVELNSYLKSGFGFHNFAALSGPTFASEIVKPYQMHCASLASRNINVIKKVKYLMRDTNLDLVGTVDLAGVSWGGCLKNAYAIGYGILEKLAGEEVAFDYLWPALSEMKIFLDLAEASPKTLRSPAVERDFYVTCRGDSRNKHFGRFLAEYHAKNDIDEYLKKNTVEGYDSLKTLWEIAHCETKPAPLLYCIHAICEFGASPDTFIDCFQRVNDDNAHLV